MHQQYKCQQQSGVRWKENATPTSAGTESICLLHRLPLTKWPQAEGSKMEGEQISFAKTKLALKFFFPFSLFCPNKFSFKLPVTLLQQKGKFYVQICNAKSHSLYNLILCVFFFFFLKEVFFLGFSFRHPRSLAWGPWFSRPILKSNPETSASYL